MRACRVTFLGGGLDSRTMMRSLFFFSIVTLCLGVTVVSNMDVFLENFQTALTPPSPPPVPFWKLHCAFFQKIRKYA